LKRQKTLGRGVWGGEKCLHLDRVYQNGKKKLTGEKSPRGAGVHIRFAGVKGRKGHWGKITYQFTKMTERGEGNLHPKNQITWAPLSTDEKVTRKGGATSMGEKESQKRQNGVGVEGNID